MDNGTLPARIKTYDGRWDLGLTRHEIMLPPLEELARPGEVTLPELALLAYTIKRYNIRRFFEIGTYKGTTTLTIAANMHPEGHVYTLDTPTVPRDLDDKDKRWCKPETVGEEFRDKPGNKEKITQLWGDSRYFGFGQFYGKMDMVFVDGAHDYKTAMSDIKNALRMIKPGGIIAVHDFAVWYPTVMSAVLDTIEEPFYTFSWTTVMMYGNKLDRLFE